MQTTMDLFQQAIQKQSAAQWARDLNIERAAFSMAKKRGHLSPAIAGCLAIELGENPEQWIAVAALETEPESTLLQRLRKSQASWRKR